MNRVIRNMRLDVGADLADVAGHAVKAERANSH